MQRAAMVKGSEEKDVIRVEGNQNEPPIETITREDGVKVSWHDGIELVPGKLGTKLSPLFLSMCTLFTTFI